MNVLIVEDDIVFSKILSKYLSKNKYDISIAYNLIETKKYIDTHEVDFIILDYNLPDGNGFDILKYLKEKGGVEIPVLFMTSVHDVKLAVQAIKKGAIDYITKPVNQDELLMILDNYQKNIHQPISPIAQEMHSNLSFIKGKSMAMQKVYEYVFAVAPTLMNVLIVGETGTGKEHLARLIHDKSNRAQQKFIAIDCGVLTNDLAASELFGHVKGAFTSADADKVGLFEMANGGTIFLDEIGNLPYDVQVKLLRALQEKSIIKVGATQSQQIDVRIIAATNEDFVNVINNQQFREDLYHRLNEFQIKIPALRNRREDILDFVAYFIEISNKEFNKQVIDVDEATRQFVQNYKWSGNVRELKNTIRRAVLLCSSDIITLELFPQEMIRAGSEPEEIVGKKVETLKDANELQEKKMIIQTLIQTNFNKSKTAKILNIDRSTLYAKMNKYGITED